MTIGPRWIGLLIAHFALWLTRKHDTRHQLTRKHHKRYHYDLDGIPRPAPWQCRCGYRDECAIHCGDGHTTGQCPPQLSSYITGTEHIPWETTEPY